MWAECKQDESLLTACGAVHNVHSSAQHLSTLLCSIPLSAKHRFYSALLQNHSAHKKERKKEKERKNLYHILHAAVGRITPPSWSFSSYSLINLTFVFKVVAFKSNCNLEKNPPCWAYSCRQATHTRAGLDTMWAAHHENIPLQTVTKSAHSLT